MKYAIALLAGCCLASTAFADFVPDPASVQREGPAYRYPQMGWIVVHVEGKPYDRGYQQGKLLAPEIAGYARCFAAMQSHKSPSDGWKLTRTLVNSLFLRRYDPELLEEQRGIADGAAAAGAKFDGRPIDLTDIVALNSWAEIVSLDAANDVTPTGLEGREFKVKPKTTAPMHCSAFAAVGPATKDGKIVIGHTSMFDLYPSLFFNVWLDVKPAKGHRFVMQAYPGAVNSGMDWYETDAGLIVLETTLDQTKFDPAGESETSRIRRAVQYADSIDDFVATLTKSNNGLYTNEWLVADTKTNEIAMLDLGTAKSRLWRSSRREWFGSTEGFYWGCNNGKDLAVRLETTAALNDRPANMVFRPEQRDRAWVQLFESHKGHIDADFARLAFSTPPLVAHSSLDAKYTTTDLASGMKSWAIFGPPCGIAWEPSHYEQENYPEVSAMAPNAWTVIKPDVNLPDPPEVAAVDLPGKLDAPSGGSDSDSSDNDQKGTAPAWHGTLLPGKDADIWLAAAFAAYEPIVEKEQSLTKPDDDSTEEKPLEHEDRVALGLMLNSYRSGYLAAARAVGETPATQVQSSVSQDEWYRIACGRGVLMLHEMRRRLGIRQFTELMDRFGREHAGKPADSKAFQAFAQGEPYKLSKAFFDAWLNTSAVPKFEIVDLKAMRLPAARNTPQSFSVLAKLHVSEPQLISSVDVTVETADDEKTQTIQVNGPTVDVRIETDKEPIRIAVDKYGQTLNSNGSIYTLASYRPERNQTLIVYGERDETAANKQAAEDLQHAIRDASTNETVAIKAELAVTDEELRTHHVILVGRPACNGLTEKYAGTFGATFGPGSFKTNGKTYANMHSGSIFSGTNPLNDRYSMIAIVALSADALLKTAPTLGARWGDAPARVISNGESKDLLLPSGDLVRGVKVE